MKNTLSRYPYPGIFIGWLLFIVIFGLRIIIIHSQGTDIAGIEQNVIYSTQVLMDKGLLYLSPGNAPFSITQYTPFYYYLCAYTAKFFNQGADNIQSLYIIGRAWDLFFNLATALLLMAIAGDVFKLPRSWSWFLFLVSFALSFSHNFAVRPDSMQDALALASIWCLLKHQAAGNRSLGLLTLGVLLSALSFFTKQSGLQYILIFGVYTMLVKDWKSFFLTIALCLLIYGALLAAFVIQQPAFLQNVVGGVANGINLKNFLVYIIGKKIFVISVWPLIFISVWLLLKNNSLKTGSSQSRLLCALWLGTLIFSTLTALKNGSTVQYYVLFINLSVLYIIKTLAESPVIKTKSKYRLPVFQAFVVILMLVYTAFDYKLIKTYDYDAGLQAQRQASTQVAQYLQSALEKYPDKYFFANLSTDYNIPSRQGINNKLYKKCLIPQLDIVQYSSGKLKVLGYKNFESMIKTNQVAYIIESEPKMDFRIIANIDDLIKTKYKLVKNISGYLIYQLDN